MPTRRSPIMITLLVLAVPAGCDGTDPPASTTEATPAAPSSAASELVATGAPLEPGTYTRTGFEPTITFDLDGSWRAVQLADGFFDVQQDVGTPDVIAVQFARPSRIFGAGGGSEPATTAEEAVASVRANPGLTEVEASASRIGGLNGLQITVENAGLLHARIMQVPPGGLGIDPERRLWIGFFDTPDGLLAIMVGGSAAEWDAALTAAEPVLESVRIGPGW